MAITITGGKYAAATLVTSTLNGAIGAGDTSIVLNNAANFATSGSITIDGEEIAYTGKSTNTLTGCARGQNGTTAASHLTGAVVKAGSLYQIVATTAVLTVADFTNIQRIVCVWNSAGTTFKGIAWVRQCVSTSVIELEKKFIDPRTGVEMTFADGDTFLVSKRWADVAQTGIVVSNNNVTVSDGAITWGTSGTSNSLCFYDESMNVVFTVNGNPLHTFAGGICVQGHLNDYATKEVYGGCNWLITANNSNSSFMKASSTKAMFLMYGGSQVTSYPGALYPWTGGYAPSPGTDFNILLFLKVYFQDFSITTAQAGGPWTVGSNHILDSCYATAFATSSAVICRWSNGIVSGCSFKIPAYSSNPMSITGSDLNGTYAFGAPASSRTIISDIGNGNRFAYASTNAIQTWNLTNVISTNYDFGYGVPPNTAHTNATKNLYFSDNYTNLLAGSSLVAIKNSDWSVDSSVASASSSVAALTVLWKTGSGFTLGSSRGPWTVRIRLYGYDEIEYAVAESNYSLGTAGTATNVAFGGLVNQIARATLPAQATADAYTGITVTDHGANPVSWQSKTWSITVTVDIATYPSRTAAHVFAYIKSQITKSANWGGKPGYLWHVLMEENPSGADYVSQRGISGGAGATQKGVRIIDQAGNPLPGVVAMVADDGTTYTPPVTYTLTVNSLQPGTDVVIKTNADPDGSGSNVLQTFDAISGTSVNYNYSNAGTTIRIAIYRAGYRPREFSYVLPANNATVPGTQTIDPSYT